MKWPTLTVTPISCASQRGTERRGKVVPEPPIVFPGPPGSAITAFRTDCWSDLHFTPGERERERERERDKRTDRQTESDRDRETDTETERDRERHRDRDTERHTHTRGHRDTETDKEAQYWNHSLNNGVRHFRSNGIRTNLAQ